MRFLRLKKDNRPRKNGTYPVKPIIVDSPRKFAPDSERKQEFMSVKRCLLITGAHDSGKTRWLSRMREEWQGIWGAKITHEPVYLGALSPVSCWTDADHVADWHDDNESHKAKEDERYRPRFWNRLNQQKKAERLSAYLQATGAILFIDDAHRLSGRKLQIARECVLSAKIWVITASQENRLAPNLRPIIERRDPQRTRLSTDASYDATGAAVWLMMLLALGIGWWEVTLVMGGLKMLGSGRTSSRAD